MDGYRQKNHVFLPVFPFKVLHAPEAKPGSSRFKFFHRFTRMGNMALGRKGKRIVAVREDVPYPVHARRVHFNMIYRQGSRFRQDPADEGTGPEGNFRAIDKMYMGKTAQRPANFLRVPGKGLVNGVHHHLGIVAVGMAESDEQADFAGIEGMPGIDHAFRMEDDREPEFDNAGKGMHDGPEKAYDRAVDFRFGQGEGSHWFCLWCVHGPQCKTAAYFTQAGLHSYWTIPGRVR